MHLDNIRATAPLIRRAAEKCGELDYVVGGKAFILFLILISPLVTNHVFNCVNLIRFWLCRVADVLWMLIFNIFTMRSKIFRRLFRRLFITSLQYCMFITIFPQEYLLLLSCCSQVNAVSDSWKLPWIASPLCTGMFILVSRVSQIKLMPSGSII